MFKPGDAKTFTSYLPLYASDPTKTDPIGDLTKPVPIGDLTLNYYIVQYNDIKVRDTVSAMPKTTRSFLVTCSQRMRIRNTAPAAPSELITSFNDYPSLIRTLMKMSVDEMSGITVQLLDYSPQTVNTTVQQAGSTGASDGTSTGTSRSSTVGSSTAVTNSYGASVSVGLTDASVSANYEHSETDTSESSATQGSENSRNRSQEASSSATMSVKDWGVYGWAEPQGEFPTWVLGQEYPWDAVLFRQYDKNKINPINASQAQIAIPSEMLLRLFDVDKSGNTLCLYPPSQLALFGINFVTKAVWLVTMPNTAPDTMEVDHYLYYNTGSHGYFAGAATAENVVVYIDTEPVELQSDNGEISTILNLPLIALDPVGSNAPNAIVGFIPSKFTVAPLQAAAPAVPPIPFKIVSTANDLMLQDTTAYPTNCGAGAGFMASPTAMQGYFASNCTSLQVSAYFKITSVSKDYTLHIKHWKLGGIDIRLTITINGTENTVVKYVDALEAEGGENNLLSVALRNLSYASVDFHDYLQLGLNAIVITIEPVGGQFTAADGYGIRAISIEQD